MHIYPYVYRLENLESGYFYYGVRWANKVNAQYDKYNGSGRHYLLKEFKFNKIIIAEFFDKIHAQEFELSIIEEHITNPLCLNIMIMPHYSTLGISVWNKGKTGVQPKQTKEILAKRFSPEARKKMSEVRLGKSTWNKGLIGYKPDMPKCSCIICKKILPINTITLHYVKH